MNMCGCRCHWGYGMIYVLGIAAALLFFWTGLTSEEVLGYDTPHYFMLATVLLLLARPGRVWCRRCLDSHGAPMIKCSHPIGCTCGDCERCK
jgi:hypothetical protein